MTNDKAQACDCWEPSIVHESSCPYLAVGTVVTPKEPCAPDASDVEEDEPIHAWFDLSYSSYLVLPRSVLQSMPVDWQRRFVELVNQVRETLEVDDMPAYRVNALDGKRFVRDPFGDYERGRRRVPRKIGGS